MAQEPDSLVLVHLREMRGQLQGITAKLEEHDRRFDQIDKRMEDFHLLVNHALGLGTMNQHKARELEARHDLADTRQRRVEERFDRIERRLAKVEERSDT
jgi:hypothetical protein